MAYFPKNKKAKRTLRPKNRPVRPTVVAPRRPSKNFTKMVQSVISRNIENKNYQASMTMDCRYPAANPTLQFNGLFPLTPYTSTGSPAGSTITIVQGVESGQRIGNTIRTKYATLKGIIFPFPLNNTLNPDPKPLEVCMWIFKLKRSDPLGGLYLSAAEDTCQTAMFQDGNSVDGITGELIDIMKTTNQDRIQLLHKRIFKVGFASGADLTTEHPNNDFKLNQKFSINITKYLPKVIKFDDGDEDPSINHTYCLIQGYCADSSVQSNGRYNLRVAWQLNYVYEDA